MTSGSETSGTGIFSGLKRMLRRRVRTSELRPVTMVGSGSKELAQYIAMRSGVSLVWFERADMRIDFSSDEVIAAIESAPPDPLLILARPEGAEVIPWPKGMRYDFIDAKVRRDPGVVILLGKARLGLHPAVAERTGVELWLFELPNLNDSFSSDEVIAAIESSQDKALLIVARPEGPEVIPLPAYDAAGQFLLRLCYSDEYDVTAYYSVADWW